MEPAYIGLGGNRDDVRATFRRAIEDLVALPGVVVVQVSSLWETEPVGPVADQPRFLNACAALVFDPENAPEPALLMAALLEIERRYGRRRGDETPMGPRALDLDLLVWGGRVLDVTGPPSLRLPHPRLAGRAFALAPLVELAGRSTRIPGADAPLGELLDAALTDPGQAVRRLGTLR